MVKKIIYILTIICSIVLGMESYDAIRHNDFNNTQGVTEYISIQENKSYKFIYLQSKNDATKSFYEIIKFCNQRNIDFVVRSEEDDYRGLRVTNYVYTKKKNLFSKLKIVNYQDIDFSDIKSNQYYTTDINDKNNKGILRTIDEHYFDDGSQFTIKNMHETDKIIKMLKSSSGMCFFVNDKDYNDLEKLFKENRIQYEDMTKGYSPVQIQEVKEERAEYLENILLSSVIIIGLLISVYLLKSNHKMMIMRLNGVSILKIIRIMILPFFIVELLLFSLGLYLTTYICAGYINDYNSDMYFSNIDMIVKFMALLFILGILIYIFIHFTSHLKYLKKNRDIKHYMELAILLKVVLIGIMLPQLITIVPREISSLSNCIALNVNRDYMSSLAFIYSLESSDGNTEAFNMYINNEGVYADFDYYTWNQEDYLKESVEERYWYQLEDIVLKYPMIYANANYLENKKIYDDFGELEFTRYGVDGPVIKSASCRMKDTTKENYKIVLDLKPALDEEKLDKRIQRDFQKYINKRFENALDDLLPKKLIPTIIRLSEIDKDTVVHQISREQRKSLVHLLKNITLTVKRYRPIEEAIINEINSSTMESKLIEGLFFAGEVIDVDAYTGGFNLQIAFSTGYLAGYYC